MFSAPKPLYIDQNYTIEGGILKLKDVLDLSRGNEYNIVYAGGGSTGLPEDPGVNAISFAEDQLIYENGWSIVFQVTVMPNIGDHTDYPYYEFTAPGNATLVGYWTKEGTDFKTPIVNGKQYTVHGNDDTIRTMCNPEGYIFYTVFDTENMKVRRYEYQETEVTLNGYLDSDGAKHDFKVGDEIVFEYLGTNSMISITNTRCVLEDGDYLDESGEVMVKGTDTHRWQLIDTTKAGEYMDLCKQLDTNVNFQNYKLTFQSQAACKNTVYIEINMENMNGVPGEMMIKDLSFIQTGDRILSLIKSNTLKDVYGEWKVDDEGRVVSDDNGYEFVEGLSPKIHKNGVIIDLENVEQSCVLSSGEYNFLENVNINEDVDLEMYRKEYQVSLKVSGTFTFEDLTIGPGVTLSAVNSTIHVNGNLAVDESSVVKCKTLII